MDITERKEASEAVARLASIVESSSDAIFSKTMDGIITSWNAGAEALYGYSSTEAIGSSVLMLLPPHHLNEESQLIAKIVRGERVTNYETVRVCKDGRHLDVSLTLSLIKDEKGKIVGAAAIAHDITNRKQAEEALRLSEERYRSLALATSQIVWSTPANGMVEDMPAWRAYTGQKIEEMQGWGWADALYPDDLEATRTIWLHCVETKSHYETEYRIRGADGNYRLFAVRGVPVLRSDGSIREWVGTCADIQDRRVAEEERDRFFTLSLDMLAIISSDGYIKRLNPAFGATLGFSDEEMMAVPFLEFVHPDDHAATLAEQKRLEAGAKVMLFENRYRCRDGSYKWLRWMCAPFEDLWYCVAHDVTSIKKSAMALHRANDELEMRVMERTAELEMANDQLHEELKERKSAEAALREAQQMLQLVMNQIPQAIFWKDLDCLYLGCNYRLAADAGLNSPEGIKGRSDRDMPWAEYAEEYRANDRQVMETDTQSSISRSSRFSPMVIQCGYAPARFRYMTAKTKWSEF